MEVIKNLLLGIIFIILSIALLFIIVWQLEIIIAFLVFILILHCMKDILKAIHKKKKPDYKYNAFTTAREIRKKLDNNFKELMKDAKI